MIETRAIYVPQMIRVEEFDEDGIKIGDTIKKSVGYELVEVDGKIVKRFLFEECE